MVNSRKLTFFHCLIAVIASLFTFAIYGKNASSNKKLSELNSTLQRLTKSQKTALLTKTKLVKELRAIDIQLSLSAKKINQLQNDIEIKESNLVDLKKQLSPLEQRFNTIQNQLHNYLVLHYQLGQAQPLELILNQRDPALTERLMTYIGYINKKRATLLKEVHQLGKELRDKHAYEQSQLLKLSQLQDKQKQAKEKYQEDKNLQTDIIATLDQSINTRAKKIYQLNQDKQRLAKLIRTIEQKKLNQTEKIPFSTLRHKLPWPTKGIVSKKSLHSELPTNGIYIKAPEGRQVSAIHSGKVVFSDWLKGYGLLIIIQHDHGFMTLYANNQALYKEKGQKVYPGQRIATIGHSGGQRSNGLYFEIRHKGKPLSPLTWLKQRT